MPEDRKRGRRKKRTGKRGPWDFLTETTIAAMRRGHLPVYLIFITLWVFLLKTPKEAYIKIWTELLDPPGLVFVLSLALNVAMPIGYWKLKRRDRSHFEAEMKRMSDVRNLAQEKAGLLINSSEDLK